MSQLGVSHVVQVITTVSSVQAARDLARHLLEERLVACVQIESGLESHYRWQGKNEVADEFRLTAKTVASVAARVMNRVEELHPYDTPEVIVVATDMVNERYAQWVENEVSQNR